MKVGELLKILDTINVGRQGYTPAMTDDEFFDLDVVIVVEDREFELDDLNIGIHTGLNAEVLMIDTKPLERSTSKVVG